ncbi:MAG: SAM-dependent DNA methyltransferase, partial [Planctomycetes bacterium]|nr:SAM-dependent DNA methyltransferase [Planctomycetota bacterium]
PALSKSCVRWLDAPADTTMYCGRSYICNSPLNSEAITSQLGSRIHGQDVWTRRGVALMKMGVRQFYGYLGEVFDDNVGIICPLNVEHLPAIWSFCESGEYTLALRQIDQKVNVTAATLTKVPFDLAHWQAVAAEKYPNGLPEPHSDDPTQWLFQGDIATSADPLQVAVARLLGYRWPEQPNEDPVVDPHVDDDGIVCLPGVKSEPPAAERLTDLLRAVGHKTEVDLAVWLRDKFFEEHCKRFQQRPFIWHIWDGRKDGFAALVNYHKLTHKALENLTYSYLGDWIAAQKKSDAVGADLRLAAAQTLQEKLKLILAGEKPYDIFVRWKPLREQAIGWHPDLNDGVRMNIRPFMKAEILRKSPNIKWTKDRGKEPEREKDDYPWFWPGGTFTGDRVNDLHLTNAEKQAARTEADK